MNVYLVIEHDQHAGMEYPEKAFLDRKAAYEYCSAQNIRLSEVGKYLYDANKRGGTYWYEVFDLEIQENI